MERLSPSPSPLPSSSYFPILWHCLRLLCVFLQQVNMCQQHLQFRCPTHNVISFYWRHYHHHITFIFTCSGDIDGSVREVVEDVDVSEHSSSISGSRVRRGNKPRITAPVIGGVINNSSIINSVSSPFSEEIDPSFG